MKAKFLLICRGGNNEELRKLVEDTFEGWWDLSFNNEDIVPYIVSSSKYTTVQEIREKFNGFQCLGFIIVKIYTSDDFYNMGNYGGDKNNKWLKNWATDDIQQLMREYQKNAIPNIGLKKKNP